jgi:hypothetical protein
MKNMKTFIGVVMTRDCWKEMCRQLRNENIREYIQEKIYLCKHVGLSFNEYKMQDLEGLYSKDLSMYLLGREYRTEDDFLGDMVEYERLDVSRTIRFHQSSVYIKDNGLYKPTTRQLNNTLPSRPTKKESTGNITTTGCE